MRRIPWASILSLLVAACGQPNDPLRAPGVSRELAEARAASISDLRYDVVLDIPAGRTEPVTGTVTAHFRWAPTGDNQPLVLDFRAPRDHVGEVLLDGERVPHELPEDHIVIPWSAVPAGEHRVTVRFTSTDAALNRNDEFLYALFVPDRASTAFPVFEQPDLKARFTLALTIPDGWKALSNGALAAEEGVVAPAGRRTLRFAETQPISTYLFSFAAGVLREERAERDGRALVLFHRETDSAKVARNLPAIFDLHAASLRWLEDYTGIPYPFGKFAFFAVPAFQFGGMEHPGAIWYRADGLFLDPTASRNQELGRASLIAHETAHMWFGDLVTMRWFDDVWMKEVFANFMAAKVAGPSFPDIDHRLRFFQAHHPAAYGVDRTAGANPIRHPLENLREAGSLYGAIIYQKAPIVMRQLEELVGEATLREGLRRYLARHAFGNATWTDLITILDALSAEDLATWSRVWVEEPGRPTIAIEPQDTAIRIAQVDTWTALQHEANGTRPRDTEQARTLGWPQPVTFAVGKGDSLGLVRVQVRGASQRISLPAALREPDFVFGGADGTSYGRFMLDSASRSALLARVATLPGAVPRAVAWQTLYEEMLDGRLAPRALFDTAIAALEVDRDELVSLQVLGMARGIYWRLLPAAERRQVAPRLEATLWRELERAPTAGRKGAFFGALVGVSLTPEGVARLERIWRKAETPAGLPLTEQQYTGLAEALAIRGVPNAEAILDEQEARITNPDRRERFRFMRPALGADVDARRALFRSFGTVENRRRESWVLDAMGAINHPLRAAEALPDLRASLELVDDIQRTGDIFFPLRWLNASLDGHQSAEAAGIVRTYLAEHPELPPRLRGKVLQAADDLFRAARIVK